MMYVTEKYITQKLGNMRVVWVKNKQGFVTKYLEEPKPVARDWLFLESRPAQKSVQAASEQVKLTETHNLPLGVYAVRNAVLKVCEIPQNEFLSNRRLRYITMARQLFYYLAKKHTRHSYPSIGQRAGVKDHSTVMYGVGKIEKLVKAGDQAVNQRIAEIERELKLA